MPAYAHLHTFTHTKSTRTHTKCLSQEATRTHLQYPVLWYGDQEAKYHRRKCPDPDKKSRPYENEGTLTDDTKQFTAETLAETSQEPPRSPKMFQDVRASCRCLVDVRCPWYFLEREKTRRRNRAISGGWRRQRTRNVGRQQDREITKCSARIGVSACPSWKQEACCPGC